MCLVMLDRRWYGFSTGIRFESSDAFFGLGRLCISRFWYWYIAYQVFDVQAWDLAIGVVILVMVGF